MVFKAPELSYPAIIEAYDRRAFYASTGPEIHGCFIEDGVFHLDCSPVRRIHVMGQGINPIHRAFSPQNDLTHIEFPMDAVPENARFLWVQLTDGAGRKAWMNPYFL